jgi:hypothetical protein
VNKLQCGTSNHACHQEIDNREKYIVPHQSLTTFSLLPPIFKIGNVPQQSFRIFQCKHSKYLPNTTRDI